MPFKDRLDKVSSTLVDIFLLPRIEDVIEAEDLLLVILPADIDRLCVTLG